MADLLDTLTIRAILKDIVGAKMGELFWQKHPLWSAIQKDGLGVKETVPGAYWYFDTVALSNPQGHKLIRESDQAFSTFYPHSRKHRVGFKLLTNTLKVYFSERYMKRADNNAEATIKYSMEETARAMTSLFLELDATAHIGCSGKITQASGVQSGAYVPVDDVNILDSMIGAYVKGYTPAASPTEKFGGPTGTAAFRAIVTSVDYDNKRVYLADPAGTAHDSTDVGAGAHDYQAAVADNDWIMRVDTPIAEVTTADPDTYTSQFGFPDLISQTAIAALDTTTTMDFGLSRTTYPQWKSQVLNVGAKPLNFHHFKQAIDLVSNRSMGAVDRIIFNTNTETEYVGQYMSRYNVNPPTMDIDGGFNAIQLTNAGKKIPLIISKKVPDYEFWALDTTSFGIKQLSDPYWREVEGQILFPSDLENISYAMVLYDWNMIAYAPGQNCRVYGFTYSETG